MSPGGSLYLGISFQIPKKKSAKSKIIELVMEGVPKTFQKHYKLKDLDFLLRNYAQLFFPTPRKNIFRSSRKKISTFFDFLNKIFEKSKSEKSREKKTMEMY